MCGYYIGGFTIFYHCSYDIETEFGKYPSVYVEPQSKSGDLGVFEHFDFFPLFTVYILNNVFCKFQVIPAKNGFGIYNFPLCCPIYNFLDKPI